MAMILTPFFYGIEGLLEFIDRGHVPSQCDAEKWNWEPVKEEVTVGRLSIQGKIPSAVYGSYVKNGANAFFKRSRRNLIDGGGTLQAVHLSETECLFSNHHVRTPRFLFDQSYGRAVFPCIGELRGKVALAKIMLAEARKAVGLAPPGFNGYCNTSVVFHGGKWLALGEDDLPFEFAFDEGGKVRTVGPHTFGGQWTQPFTGHPKLDPITGELLFFGYHVLPPYLTAGIAAPSGELVKKLEIDIPEPVGKFVTWLRMNEPNYAEEAGSNE